MRYEEETVSHEFYVRVYPPRMSESEKILQEISEKVRQTDEETKTQAYLPLPGNVNGIEIQWDYTENIRAFAMLILGAGGACMICVSDRQRRKEEEKKKIRQMKTDYPQIINKFNLYIGAGMTVRRAWFCIAGITRKKKREPENGRLMKKWYTPCIRYREGLQKGRHTKVMEPDAEFLLTVNSEPCFHKISGKDQKGCLSC